MGLPLVTVTTRSSKAPVRGPSGIGGSFGFHESYAYAQFPTVCVTGRPSTATYTRASVTAVSADALSVTCPGDVKLTTVVIGQLLADPPGQAELPAP